LVSPLPPVLVLETPTLFGFAEHELCEVTLMPYSEALVTVSLFWLNTFQQPFSVYTLWVWNVSRYAFFAVLPVIV